MSCHPGGDDCNLGGVTTRGTEFLKDFFVSGIPTSFDFPTHRNLTPG